MRAAGKICWIVVLSFAMQSGVCGQDDFGGSGGGFAGDPSQSFGEVHHADHDAAIDISNEIRSMRRGHRESVGQANELPEPVRTDVMQTPAVAAIHRKLDQKQNFDFDVPLAEFMAWLEESLKVNVIFDRRALHDNAIDENTDSCYLWAQGISYRSALNLLLEPLDLAWLVDENGITITTREVEDETLTVTVYPVWDLVKSPLSNRPGDADPHPLIHCITSTIAPETWSQVGGPARVTYFKGMLTISQTSRTHATIVSLLKGIRRFPVTRKHDNMREVIRTVGLDDDDRKAAIVRALQKRDSFYLVEVPLSEAAEMLREKIKVPIQFDRRSLEDESIDATSDTVSVQLKDVTVGEALSLMLKEHNLRWVIRDEVVMITTQAMAEETLRTRLYHCRALATVDDASPTQRLDDLTALANNIQATISPDSWDEVGGPGAIEIYADRSLLVVSNTDPVLDRVAQYLPMLVAGKQGGNAAPSSNESPAEVLVKSYRLAHDYRSATLRGEVMESLQSLLRGSDNELYGPDGRFFIRAVGNNLIISHRRDVHENIASVLNKLNALERSPGSGMQGGMF